MMQFLIVGGSWDGQRVECTHATPFMEMPRFVPNRGPMAAQEDVVGELYEREEIHFTHQQSVVFYRHKSLKAREALAKIVEAYPAR